MRVQVKLQSLEKNLDFQSTVYLEAELNPKPQTLNPFNQQCIWKRTTYFAHSSPNASAPPDTFALKYANQLKWDIFNASEVGGLKPFKDPDRKLLGLDHTFKHSVRNMHLWDRS